MGCRLGYYDRARQFDPGLGRFLARDPISYEGSQWNLLEYVCGRPLILLDPSGVSSLNQLLAQLAENVMNAGCTHFHDDFHCKVCCSAAAAAAQAAVGAALAAAIAACEATGPAAPACIALVMAEYFSGLANLNGRNSWLL